MWISIFDLVKQRDRLLDMMDALIMEIKTLQAEKIRLKAEIIMLKGATV